jgi:hypothetical protein
MYVNGGSGSIVSCAFDGNEDAGLWLDNYASHTIENSVFSNTTDGDGVRFYRHSDASVDSCTMQQNAGHGALVHTSSPAFYGCTITDNAANGILIRRLAQPTVGWSTISGNDLGVSVESGAFPNLGDMMHEGTGNNSIMNNAVAAVANYTDGDFPVEIRGNWWGTYPPIGRPFIGYVRYYPCLRLPPGQGSGDRDFVDPEELPPAAFRLGHCTPNPFNPVTSIDYDVPEGAGPVNIAVFDVAGRMVTTLYSGHHEPGVHRITWNGRDSRGRSVASGIYFVRLEAMDFQASRKMVLLK